MKFQEYRQRVRPGRPTLSMEITIPGVKSEDQGNNLIHTGWCSLALKSPDNGTFCISPLPLPLKDPWPGPRRERCPSWCKATPGISGEGAHPTQEATYRGQVLTPCPPGEEGHRWRHRPLSPRDQLRWRPPVFRAQTLPLAHPFGTRPPNSGRIPLVLCLLPAVQYRSRPTLSSSASSSSSLPRGHLPASPSPPQITPHYPGLSALGGRPAVANPLPLSKPLPASPPYPPAATESPPSLVLLLQPCRLCHRRRCKATCAWPSITNTLPHQPLTYTPACAHRP